MSVLCRLDGQTWPLQGVVDTEASTGRLRMYVALHGHGTYPCPSTFMRAFPWPTNAAPIRARSGSLTHASFFPPPTLTKVRVPTELMPLPPPPPPPPHPTLLHLMHAFFLASYSCIDASPVWQPDSCIIHCTSASHQGKGAVLTGQDTPLPGSWPTTAAAMQALSGSQPNASSFPPFALT